MHAPLSLSLSIELATSSLYHFADLPVIVFFFFFFFFFFLLYVMSLAVRCVPSCLSLTRTHPAPLMDRLISSRCTRTIVQINRTL
jgi:hypothetical protein